jgi:hypothetical protein
MPLRGMADIDLLPLLQNLPSFAFGLLPRLVAMAVFLLRMVNTDLKYCISHLVCVVFLQMHMPCTLPQRFT